MGRRGFSLVELLVVLAIIGILVSICLAALSRGRHKAIQTANMTRMRDDGMGRMASGSNASRDFYRPTRENARAAFRENAGPGYANGANIIVSRMLFSVSGDDVFRAYWHTLLNVENTAPLEYDGRKLKAKDKEGKEYWLDPMGDAVQGRMPDTKAPVEWEFLSIDLSDTSSGTIGANVLYPDGDVQHVRYPGDFPMTRAVAELSHEFMKSWKDRQ